MRARDRRYGKNSTKTRVGIAAAALAGGAVAIAAVLTGSHGAGTVATSAAYSSRTGNEGAILSSAMNSWNGARQSSFAQLSRLTQARQFSQVRHNGKTLAIQRGIVVLATKKFLILRSSNGSLHLWLLSGKTKFQNVSNSMAGLRALTASAGAARQAMGSGNMTPATSLLAGNPSTAAAMLTPTPAAQTVTVQVANTNLTVTITVTRSMATVNQTATMPQAAMPAWHPVTFTQNAWHATHTLARCDLVLVAGTRSHRTLHAQLVLFAPLSAATAGKAAAGTGATPVVMPTAAPTHW
jgi:hypothetical protein